MPNEVLAMLAGIAILLPLLGTGMLRIVKDHLVRTPLWLKLLFPWLLLAAISFFVLMGVIGGHHFNDNSDDWAVYWIFGVIIDLFAAIWMATILD